MQKIIYIPIDTLIDNTVECTKLVKRGDTLTLQIKVFSNGSLADLTGQSIDLILRKSDNTIIEKTITSVVNGVITVVLTEQATLIEGLVSGEIQIYNSTSHIGTNTFTFNVSNSIADDVLAKSENEIETLIDLKTVIDSNNATISEYVSNITQIAGTAESVQALAGTKLYIDTNLEDLQQANAKAVINIVNENTQNDEATQNIADLTTLNNTANTLNVDLEGNILTGNSLNTDLEGNITNGNVLNVDLEGNISTGNTLNANLESTITTGNTLKTNIDSENVRAEANITAMQGFGDVTVLAQDVTTLKTEVETARNGEVSLDVRLDKNDTLVASHTTSLSEKANQSSLNTTNASISNHLADLVIDSDGAHGLHVETGTFTPILVGTTVAGVNTYSRKLGKYTRVGNKVTLDIALILTSKDSAMNGLIDIIGLPFIVKQDVINGIGSIWFHSVSLGTYKNISPVAFSDRIRMYMVGDNTVPYAINAPNINNNSEINISITHDI